MSTLMLPMLLLELGPTYPAWMDDAVCSHYDPDLWFRSSAGNRSLAKKICGECPVRERCIEHAMTLTMANRPPVGIWGGTDRATRARAATQRRKEMQQ